MVSYREIRQLSLVEPDTRTERLNFIADEFEYEGNYTRAASVRAVVKERDALQERVRELEASVRGATAALTRVAPKAAPADPVNEAWFNSSAYKNWVGAIIHPECISDVPEGYDTVLGFLAKRHPDVLEAFDYTNPLNTVRDGWWLARRVKGEKHVRVEDRYAEAPPVLKEKGIERVRIYPVSLLEQRWS
jgi:hypothetical protein